MEFLLSEKSKYDDLKLNNIEKLNIINEEIKKIIDVENRIEVKLADQIGQMNNLKFDIYKNRIFYDNIIKNLGQ